ncbi:MAG TPA: ABC transporter substrate-binding protein [Casimicrobiaceae bacterium]|nr:ABC transporter substrate-binding protein [Casimicrobiaceae bacterium]
MLTRRDVLKAMAATGAYSMSPAFAQGKRPLKANLLGFALGIHAPTTAALFDIMPTMGYAPETQRLDQIRTLTQTLIAGAAEMGETDSITVMSAVEQGADLKIVGLWYMNTSLVFLVNADKVRDFKDLEKPDNIVAVNGKGDITHVMLLGPLLKRGVDIKKLNIVEIGGSGARMQALQSGRVAAVPIHFDQAAEVAKKGNFKVLLEPWKEYGAWINEIWAVNGSWLKKKENERMVIDMLKAQMTAWRKANADLNWYTEAYRKHVTLKDAKSATPEQLRPLWEGLTKEIKAFPPVMELKLEYWNDLLPAYIQAGAIEGKVKVASVIEPSLAKQAASELG